MVETETRILKMIKHENIVQLYEMYEFEGKIYLVMELVTGGELFDEIMGRGTFVERDAALIVQKILKAVKYLHKMGIVHRDLKPENLLLSDRSRNPEIKISDFGLSKIFKESEMLRTACGTPGYVAPEVLKKRGYGRQVDLWSLGVITYILLCGYPPFFDASNPELFRKIMAGRFQFDRPWWDNISNSGLTGVTVAKDFITKLLIVEPHLRWTADQALLHPFIFENCKPGHFQTPMIPIPPPIMPHHFMLQQVTVTIPSTHPVTIKKPTTNLKAYQKVQKRKEGDQNTKPTVEDQKQPQFPSDPVQKSQFSAKVNRIASWFRMATLAEKSSKNS